MAHEKEDQHQHSHSRKKLQQYPLESSSYKILEEIGSGVSAIVYKAECIPMDSSLVAIKAINLDESRVDLDKVRREAKTMSLLSHPNILNAYCSFTVDRRLWVVMPFMSGGSFHSIISSSFPNGLPEPCIAIVLKETLKALSYLHDQGHLHRDIKAGNILVDSNGSVKVADFGVSASVYESNLNSGSYSTSSFLSSSMRFTDVAGTPYWMAPEVIHSHTGYSFKADIWSFGITALELAHGRPPLSHLPPSKSLITKITKRFRFSDYSKTIDAENKKFSKSFKEMVKSCLDPDPSKRPTADKLLKHSFFKNCKNSEFLVKKMLEGIPNVEQRFKERKILRIASMNRSSEEEEDNEEDSSSIGDRTKQRRISGWNFNEDEFELDPVFPSPTERLSEEEFVVKQVRFGGETIIPNQPTVGGGGSKSNSTESVHYSDETNSSSITRVSNPEEVNEACNEQNVGELGGFYVNRETMLSSLGVLKKSLEEQRQQVMLLIHALGGGCDESVEGGGGEEFQLRQVIEMVVKELEMEKQRSFALELELEFYKLQYSNASSGQSQFSSI